MHPSPDPKKRAQPGWENLFKPPAQFVPKTLDELMLWRRQTAEGLMRHGGSVPPLLVILSEDGVQMMSVGKLETVGDKKELVLSPLDKLEEPASLLALREAVIARLPEVDLPEILLEISARTGFTDAFTHLTERTARAQDLRDRRTMSVM